MNLNEKQKKIIKNINGIILVIAGAGSGKTSIITYRTAYMIHNMNINPERILILTFTRKAAKEMKDRISSIISKKKLDKLTIGTFHSIFSNILRKESHHIGYKSNYNIYDKKDSENILKKILLELNLEKEFNYKKLRKKISDFKNKTIFFNKKSSSGVFNKIYKNYVNKCFQLGAMDFDDIMLYSNFLFKNSSKILEKYQKKFKYILVDEYQDINYSQNNIIKYLFLKHKNLFVVGDDAQSIYSFRGANIANILNFHVEYKKVKIFRLEQNYRSTNCIIKASNKVISFNKNRISKKVWTNNEEGEKIKIYRFDSEIEEAEYIAKSIISIKKKTLFSYSNFAILYRINSQSYVIESILKKYRIPYKIFGNTSFERKKEICNLLDFLRVINNTNDEEALLRILKRKIKYSKTIDFIIKKSQEKKESIYEIIKNVDSLYNFRKKTKEKLYDIVRIINNLKKDISLNKDIYIIVKKLIFYIEGKKEKDISNYYNFFINQIDSFFKEKNQFGKKRYNQLSAFLQNFYLDESEKEINKNEKDKVSLMTIHLSKGLEFSTVFISGLEENIFPSKSSSCENSKIEEERRLFYVALTRAKKIVILTYVKSRFLWGKKFLNPPSRFIKEVFFEKKNISNIISDRKIKKDINVFHEIFGMGKILYIEKNNKIARIFFYKKGEKRILLKSNKLLIKK